MFRQQYITCKLNWSWKTNHESFQINETRIEYFFMRLYFCLVHEKNCKDSNTLDLLVRKVRRIFERLIILGNENFQHTHTHIYLYINSEAL